MLWYKAWLETRWRFLIGLALLMLSACASVLGYPQTMKVLSALPQAALPAGYHDYIWSQWIREGMRQLWALFAALLGTGGLLSQASRGGALFTLSLPVSRGRVLGIRTAAALAELAILAMVPMLLVPLLCRSWARPTVSLTRSCTAAACSLRARRSSASRCCCPPCSAISGVRH